MAKTKRIKYIDAGPLHEVVIYTPPSRGDNPRQRAQKSKATTQAQNAMNLKNRTKRLEFLIAGNFSPRDRFITLTYDDTHLPATRKDARATLQRFISQLREVRKKSGSTVKYIYCTEGLHGESRLHHHLMLSAAPGDIEQLQSLWTFGSVDVETLGKYGNDRCSILATYMLKERKPNGEQGYTISKNIEQPHIHSEWIEEDCALIAPRDVIVLEEGKEQQQYSEYYHLKYIRPEQGETTGKKTKRGARPSLDLETDNNFRQRGREKRPRCLK